MVTLFFGHRQIVAIGAPPPRHVALSANAALPARVDRFVILTALRNDAEAGSTGMRLPVTSDSGPTQADIVERQTSP